MVYTHLETLCHRQVKGHKPYVPITCTRLRNRSRLLQVLLSSAQELIYHEGFTAIVSGDRARIRSRPTQAVLGISTSTLQSPRRQGRGQIPPAALFPCHSLTPSTAALLPYWVQRVENQDKQRATSWGIIQSFRASLFCPCDWSLSTKPDPESRRQHFSFVKSVTSEVVVSSSYLD